MTLDELPEREGGGIGGTLKTGAVVDSEELAVLGVACSKPLEVVPPFDSSVVLGTGGGPTTGSRSIVGGAAGGTGVVAPTVEIAGLLSVMEVAGVTLAGTVLVDSLVDAGTLPVAGFVPLAIGVAGVVP
jgi:hypothetical protein